MAQYLTILGELYHFIFDVCNSYHGTNPYHNFRHAVDVMQANYYFLCRMGLIKPMYPTEELFNTEYDYQNPIVRLLTPLDIFALLMASIGHDVGHPGVNNNFMASNLLFKQSSLFISICRLLHLLLWLSSIMINLY